MAVSGDERNSPTVDSQLDQVVVCVVGRYPGGRIFRVLVHACLGAELTDPGLNVGGVQLIPATDAGMLERLFHFPQQARTRGHLELAREPVVKNMRSTAGPG